MSRTADRFYFGWCNACERYAAGHSAATIGATPCSEAVITTADDATAVVAGVQAALACISNPNSTVAKQAARSNGLTPAQFADLHALALSV